MKAIKESRSIEVYCLLHKLGFEFNGNIGDWVGELYSRYMVDHFDIIKFLCSISVSWGNDIMKDIMVHGSPEMIQYARDNGCPWLNRGAEYERLLCKENSWEFKDGKCVKVDNLDKWKYLIDVERCRMVHGDSGHACWSLAGGLLHRHGLGHHRGGAGSL